MTIELSSDFLQPWLAVSPLSGVLAPGAEAVVSATFNSEELPEGIYTGEINILSNDPDQFFIEVPVQMDVGTGCEIVGDINSDGFTNIQDIIVTISYSLDDIYEPCADINQDGEVNILDIIQIVNIIVG